MVKWLLISKQIFKVRFFVLLLWFESSLYIWIQVLYHICGLWYFFFSSPWFIFCSLTISLEVQTFLVLVKSSLSIIFIYRSCFWCNLYLTQGHKDFFLYFLLGLHFLDLWVFWVSICIWCKVRIENRPYGPSCTSIVCSLNCLCTFIENILLIYVGLFLDSILILFHYYICLSFL